MKTYLMTFTQENRAKIPDGTKTKTRRVIEKIDQYKNIKPGDHILIMKNRFQKRENAIMELICTGTRTENIQDISTEDIIHEGCSTNLIEYDAEVDLLLQFTELWDSINKKRGYSWQKNPKVRVINFAFFRMCQ